ncbi:hypothetical protein PVK06_002113 [Gossypium arboreum]|uniref:Reverse transcriptase n=1 Tax=Gossypium arboreum TaxID=29729 RepID=A0ABR0R457_GOSAR|nr:hypothetical protein PVK06_002113 [Gossypium arboreum]
MDGAMAIKAVINEYENLSGQLVNFEKLIYFSKNVQDDIQRQIGGVLGVRISNNPEKYLSLPTMIRRKKRCFLELKERFIQKTKNWSIRNLSIGGKEIFIKSILQALPIYAMQCFKLPVLLCKDLENLISKFWWRNLKTNKGIHWYSWSGMCSPKAFGGMGFKDLPMFNTALLAKQGWRLITQPDCLFARVMKLKYYRRDNFLNARLGASPSFTRRSIWNA